MGTVFASSALPPFFTSTSSRAVINAPLVPLTTPISGKVTSLGSTDDITVENDRVDNSTLIGLKVQLTALQNEFEQKNSIAVDYAQRLHGLENDLRDQQTALLARIDADLKAAQAAFEMVTYSARIARSQAARKLKLMTKGIAAGSADEIADTVRLEDTKVEAAKLAVAKLSTEFDFARKGIYVGSELQSLQNLQLEIRTRKADLLQIKMQIATMQSKEAELNGLVMTESQRIDRLARADIRIPPTNVLYKPVAASGREVTAGDTLAETLDCRQAFIVAIFSERQAQALAVSSKVQVNAENWGQPVDGVVERLIPRTTERVDLDYAVPFPPTERRELYAYIRLTEFARSSVQSKQFCSVGTWVEVTMPHEWVQRTEDYIREASTSLLGIAQASPAQWPAARAELSGVVRQSAERIGLMASEDQRSKSRRDGQPAVDRDRIRVGHAEENAIDLLNDRMGILPRKG
ncbi:MULTISPECIES: HlyD family efflux transporter periplasmic adaptor subunit [unclassified Rhizobium]|uniref:HlyD family efflux transporter periplasmic adaptor subunit n=1 Tax=unclassified Rhizobium TaxID=2613769 RepID=UPI000EA9064E|nr:MULTISPECIES: HlyD family efflux transporter periplasmic adaptor subunit [unclassified Rhizobium]AYG70092.1 HlyD family secretion protein [Rhizobium sp. CCGE531]AYG76467.1 HlyD family secretion protein [Rhizobium sp. CCGE532]